CARNDEKRAVDAVDALPGQTRRAVEQNVPVGEGDTAQAGACRPEIFHVVAFGVRDRDAAGEVADDRSAVTADPRRTAIHFKAGDPAAVLPVVAGLTAKDPAVGVDAAKCDEWNH